MAKCSFCGKPVTSGLVHHAKCWKEKVLLVAERFCDELCKIPYEREDQEDLDERCKEVCPFNELLKEGR